MLVGFLIPAVIFESRGQGAGFQGFSIKASPGALSYYGDLSTDNLNLPKRVVTGSKFGIGAGIMKQFTPFFGVQAQFLAGNLYTSAPDNTFFAGALSEFSLSARFDPIRLLKGKSFRLSPYLALGVGSFSFRSVRREMGTNVVLLPSFGYENDGVTNSKKQTAMSLPITIGLSYTILPNLQVELEHALRLTNTDLLDCFKGPGTKNDLYSLTSLGLRYTIAKKPAKAPVTLDTRDTEPLTKPEKIALAEKPESREVNIYIECEIPETIKAGQTADIKLRINKGNYQGPAKLIQKFPDGFTAIENLKNTNSFLFSNQNAIIEWNQIPADSTVFYNYRVKVGENVTGNQTIAGKFEYQSEGNQTVRFNKTVFIDSEKQVSENEIPINQLLKESSPIGTDKTGRLTKSNIKQSQPLAGVEFRVQCGAFRDKNQADTQLAAKYKITEIIQEEYLDGWYKYTVGSFRSYEGAASYRDSFIARTNILSAFIVAYRDGHRLSNITEAFK